MEYFQHTYYVIERELNYGPMTEAEQHSRHHTCAMLSCHFHGVLLLACCFASVRWLYL